MKKLFFVLICSFFLVPSLEAQDDIKFGVTGGLINSRLNNRVAPLGFNLFDSNLISGTGFYIGGVASVGLSEKFAVQPELLYANANDLEYIQLPIMLKYYVIDGLYAQVGPQFSISTNADDVGNILELLDNSGEILGLNSFGIDIGFGAGYDLLDNLTVQARYSAELTNRIDGAAGSIFKGKVYNFVLGATFFF